MAQIVVRYFPTVLAVAVSIAFGAPEIHRADRANAEESIKTVRVGYQKYGTLILLKGSRALEQRLQPMGVSVTWTEFPGGVALLEALNLGSVDFGTTGDAPPIVAQAAGAPLVYVGFEPPTPEGEAIVVTKDSSIKAVTDLKGKKIATNKGGNAHYLSITAIEKAGLKVTDVEFTWLPPSGARPALERGALDSWASWDPFLASVETDIGARVIADGHSAGIANYAFYLARRPFLESRPDLVTILLEEIKKIDEAAKQDPAPIAAIVAKETGISLVTIERALRRMGFGVQPVTDRVVTEQQKIAETFLRLGVILRPINVADVVWKAQSN